MIASFRAADGEELVYDVPCLSDFECLVAEARTEVLLEHENGSSLSFACAEGIADLAWIDPLHYEYFWRGPEQDGLDCVRSYLETGWPRSERVRFIPEPG